MRSNVLAVIMAGLVFTSGCAHSPQAPTDIKRCAVALTVLHAAADCTAIPNGGCTMTLADLMRVQDAGADKQIYCPRNDEGETP